MRLQRGRSSSAAVWGDRRKSGITGSTEPPDDLRFPPGDPMEHSCSSTRQGREEERPQISVTCTTTSLARSAVRGGRRGASRLARGVERRSSRGKHGHGSRGEQTLRGADTKAPSSDVRKSEGPAPEAEMDALKAQAGHVARLGDERENGTRRREAHGGTTSPKIDPCLRADNRRLRAHDYPATRRNGRSGGQRRGCERKRRRNRGQSTHVRKR